MKKDILISHQKTRGEASEWVEKNLGIMKKLGVKEPTEREFEKIREEEWEKALKKRKLL